MTSPAVRPVAVLFGGTSAEAEVSVVSGTAIAAALASRGIAVRQVLVRRDGSLAMLPAGHLRGERSPREYTQGAPAALGAEPIALDALLGELRRDGGVAVPALHGPGDEDGALQVALAAHGIPFVGADHAAARLGMEKPRFKALAASLGLPVLPHLVVDAAEWHRDREASMARVAAFAATATDDGALIGKPTAHGSSIGMRIARGAGEWGAAVDLALEFGDAALLEPYLERPRELEVALLEYPSGDVAAFGPGEVFSGRDFYDYEAKYAPGVSRTTVSPSIEGSLQAALHGAAQALFAASGCRGLARIDFLVAQRGSRAGAWFVSEINTFPGFTPISLYPALVEAAGIPFADLCELLVETAAARQAGGA